MSSSFAAPFFDPLFQKFSGRFRLLFYWMVLGVFLFFHLVVYRPFAGFYPFAPLLFLVSFVFLADILYLFFTSSSFFDSLSDGRRRLVSKQAFVIDSCFIFGLAWILGGAWLAAPLIAAFLLMLRSGLAAVLSGKGGARLDSALSIAATGFWSAFLISAALLFRGELEAPQAAFVNGGAFLGMVLSAGLCQGVFYFLKQDFQPEFTPQSGFGFDRSGQAERNLSFRLARHLKAALNALINSATEERAALDKLQSLKSRTARLADFMDSCQKKGRAFHQADAFPDLIRDLKQQLKDSSLSPENSPETRVPETRAPETAKAPRAQAAETRVSEKQVASRLETLRQGILRFIDFVEEPYDSPFQEIRNFNELARTALAESLEENLKKDRPLKNLQEKQDLRAQGAVKGSPEDLKKAVKELLTNSLEALEGEKNPALFLKTYSSGGFLILEVIDNGHGMGEEERKQAFDPLPLFSKRRGSLRGLGLSLAEKIVKAHGGFIELESANEAWREEALSKNPERAGAKNSDSKNSENQNKGVLARIGLPLSPLRKQDSADARRLKRRSA